MQLNNLDPKYIVIDGIDGCGKTTQLGRLAEYLKGKGINTVVTKEPGGTNEGVELRRMLISTEFSLEPESEIMLYCVDRFEHQKKKIIPSLEDGKWVLSDRFAASTYAYQIAGRIQDSALLDYLTDKVVLRKPDLTIIIDIDSDKSHARAMERLKRDGKVDAEGKFELLGLEFMQRVRKGFLDYALFTPDCVAIDGNGSVDEVFENIVKELERKL